MPKLSLTMYWTKPTDNTKHLRCSLYTLDLPVTKRYTTIIEDQLLTLIPRVIHSVCGEKTTHLFFNFEIKLEKMYDNIVQLENDIPEIIKLVNADTYVNNQREDSEFVKKFGSLPEKFEL